MADDYANMGHNEATARLGLLAEDARKGLERVANGEADAIEGWLAYGHALNEGRALFHPDDDKGFGKWVADLHRQLVGVEPNDHERAAAMWAAANPDQFEEAREKGSARTVRGIHAKWKELVEARAAIAEAERLLKESEQARKQSAKLEQVEAEAEAQFHSAPDEKAREEAESKLAEVQEHRKKAESNAVEAEAKYEEVAKRAHVSNNSGNNEWYTPAAIIETACAVMGGFDLDPASSEVANQTVKADKIFTAEDDGLKQEWPVGRIWMNPPYAQPLIGQFASKFAAEIRRGSQGVVLVNNATETAWFQEMAAECSAICFPRARIKFLDPDGNPGAPLQGQAIIYCGPDADVFEEAFHAFGLVVRHG